ncbi:MAG TPA: CIA30 family protein [Lacunisphaera sp.]|nr:CIA30 family protein [Lacunisphaera sp.]
MHSFLRCFPLAPIVLLVLATGGPALRAATPALIDDFSNPAQTARGAARLLITDKDAGSQSSATQRCERGILIVEGQLKPGRGAPAFISIPLLLTPDGKPVDVGAFTGVRLRVKLVQGALSVQVSSADIDNFDFHSAPVAATCGEFTEVRLPFADMKRAWSAQTALNTKLATSVNLVAFAMAPAAFGFEVDEIGFY